MNRVPSAICSFLFAALVPLAFAQDPPKKDFIKYKPSKLVRVVPNLVYAKYGQRTLRLDLYLPAQDLEAHRKDGRALPGVIVIRGGGWMVHDKKRFAHISSAMAERGVAAACIEYRSAKETAFPGAIQDVKAAVRWMRANAPQYGIDPERIATMGGSSGAHMALLAALTPNTNEFEGDGGNRKVSSRIQAVVAMATPVDLLALQPDNQAGVAKFLHATSEQDRAKWEFASPIHHVAENEREGPKVLMLHGGADDAVKPSQSTEFSRRYGEAGGRAEVEIIPGAPHAFWNYYPWFAPAMDRAAEFLKR